MSDIQAVIEAIRHAFAESDYPGDAYLQGSREGCEPGEEVGPFAGKRRWQEVEPAFLDAHAGALSFFSEAGLRFYLPAYLVADLNGQLGVADPLFHVTHGFAEVDVEVPTSGGTHLVRAGKSALVNPRRYGAMAFQDYARYRLSVFAREEAEAIVAYLEYRRDVTTTGTVREVIDAALESFWLERAQTAPRLEDLRRHVAQQNAFLADAQDGAGEC